MKILILQESYPSEDSPYSQTWSHTRNKAYINMGLDVDVVSASEKEDRVFDGVKVSPLKCFNQLALAADLILIHQPNIKLHFRKLWKLRCKKIIYFIHGHEVMFMNEDYSTPYVYLKNKVGLSKLTRFFYDRIKVKLLKLLFRRGGVGKVGFVFVSQWMKETFTHRVNMDLDLERFRYSIIPNAISESFINNKYSPSTKSLADFVCLRHWDSSKHAVDLVLEAALYNADKSFHIYGNGELPDKVNIPSNVKMINGFFIPSELPELLNQYKCALMPTRVDSQGVMACELAEYGIPLITSDIDVAREFLDKKGNVSFKSNSNWYSKLVIPSQDSSSLSFLHSANTCAQEKEFFEYFCNTSILE